MKSFNRKLFAALGIVSAFILACLLTVVAPAYAADGTVVDASGVSVEIAELKVSAQAGEVSPDEGRVVAELENPEDANTYLADLSEDDLLYTAVHVEMAPSGTSAYSIVVYAEPVWQEEMPLDASAGSAVSDASFQDTLRAGWENVNTVVYVGSFGIDWDDFSTTYYQAVLDSPEQFNVVTSYEYYYDGSHLVTQVRPFYLTTDVEEYKSQREAYEAKINEALAQVPCGATDLAKVYILHNWVCDNVSYAYGKYYANNSSAYDSNGNFLGWEHLEFPRIYTSYGMMVEGDAVCQGYALALSDLLNRAGVENQELHVYGHNHDWNLVKVDGSWYHVDATWDDYRYGSYGFSYFMKSDTGINWDSDSTHKDWSNPDYAWGWQSYMAATNTQYDSYLGRDYWGEYDPSAGISESVHTWNTTGEVTEKATCASAGVKTYTCTKCTATKTETIPALGGDHNWQLDTATTIADGIRTYKCTKCEATETEISWNRLYGNSRYSTMESISREGWWSGRDNVNAVVIAVGTNFADALAASSLAGLKNCPILLTDGNSLSEEVASEIERFAAKTAYIVGGASAISSSVEAQVKEAGCTSVLRIYGNSRQETAQAIANELGAEHGDTCIIATGSNYPDALSISAYSFAKKAPIFLTENDNTLSASTLSAIKQAGYKNAVIVGGTGVVSTYAETQLKTSGVTSVKRLGGSSRYETSTLIANWCLTQGMTAEYACVATGKNFADALAGGAFCGKNNSVMLLVEDDDVSCISGFITTNKDSLTNGFVLGGEAAVSADIYNRLLCLI